MIGVALLLVTLQFLLSYTADQLLIWASFFEGTSNPNIDLEVNMLSILLMLLVNSIFEEVLLIGYLFKRLKRYPIAIPIVVGTLIRISFHTYQGIEEIPRVIILEFVLGIFYGKYKKLWPVILAHGIGNLIYFLNQEYQWLEL